MVSIAAAQLIAQTAAPRAAAIPRRPDVPAAVVLTGFQLAQDGSTLTIVMSGVADRLAPSLKLWAAVKQGAGGKELYWPKAPVRLFAGGFEVAIDEWKPRRGATYCGAILGAFPREDREIRTWLAGTDFPGLPLRRLEMASRCAVLN